MIMIMTVLIGFHTYQKVKFNFHLFLFIIFESWCNQIFLVCCLEYLTRPSKDSINVAKIAESVFSSAFIK